VAAVVSAGTSRSGCCSTSPSTPDRSSPARQPSTTRPPGRRPTEEQLEWRFDPRCQARLPIADRYDLPVIVFCQEGYTSSLAAAALHDIGLHQATDIIRGFAAWAAAGLPRLRPS